MNGNHKARITLTVGVLVAAEFGVGLAMTSQTLFALEPTIAFTSTRDNTSLMPSTAFASRGNSLAAKSLLATAPFCNDGWASLGAGLSPGGAVYATAVAGEVVYVAGDFTDAGGSPANYVAKWNGTSWSALGSGFVDTVYAAALSGDDFYAAGYFETPDGSVANRIVKWDGGSWSVLGEFANGDENYFVAMAVAGSDIYVAETFYLYWPYYWEGYILHKWDGTNWSTLPALNGAVNAITVSGNDVYVGGYFTEAGGVPANNIAKWDGDNWSALGPGVNGGVTAIAISGSDAVRRRLVHNGWERSGELRCEMEWQQLVCSRFRFEPFCLRDRCGGKRCVCWRRVHFSRNYPGKSDRQMEQHWLVCSRCRIELMGYDGARFG